MVKDKYYVVANSTTEDGMLEQITNGLDNYEQALKYKNGSFCKSRWPNAFIIKTTYEEGQEEDSQYYF